MKSLLSKKQYGQQKRKNKETTNKTEKIVQ